MHRKLSLVGLALCLAGGLVFAEVKTTDPKTLQIRAIGKELKCQCGCSYTVADCNMLYCHFRDPVNQDIGDMLEAGMSPTQIMDALVEKYGAELRTEPPPEGFGAVGWAMPFAALALGFVIAPFVVRRWRKNQEAAEQEAPLEEADPETIKRLEAEIERDLAQFD